MNKIEFKKVIFSFIFFSITSYAHISKDEHHLQTPELGYDIAINLQVDKVPELDKTVNINLEINSLFQNIQDVKVEMILQEGLVSRQNNVSKQLDILQPQLKQNLQFNFAALNPGKYKVIIKVTGMLDGKKPTDRYAYYYFTVNRDKSLNKIGWPKSTPAENEDSIWEASQSKELEVDSEGFVILLDADEELNEVIKKVPLEQYNAQVSRGTTVTVTGRYRFRNREDTVNVGFYHNLMELVRADNGDHLDWDYSDDNGYFAFDPVTNPGATGMKVKVFSSRFITGDIGYGTCVYPSCIDNAASDGANTSHFYTRQTTTFIVGNGNQDIGTYTTGYSLDNNLRAFWIKDDLDKGNNYLVQNSSIRGPFTVEWAADNPTHGNHYHRGLNMHFEADVGDGTNHTVMHELGHNIMYNAGTFPAGSDCPSPHYANRVSGTQCAWTEGWASSFTVLVNNEPKKCFPPSTTNCTLYDTDPSYDVCGTAWDCGATADQVEGHVTGALWDLYDSGVDDFDIETYGSNEVLRILEDDTNNSFASWWNSWINKGYSIRGLNSLFQNAIVYGDDYDIGVSFSSNSNNAPSENESFTVAISVINNGEISSIATNIRFYLSSNSFISGSDTYIGTDYKGVLDGGNAVIATKVYSVATAGQYYVGVCIDDVYGFDSNSGNNCTTGVEINVTPFDLIFEDGFE